MMLLQIHAQRHLSLLRIHRQYNAAHIRAHNNLCHAPSDVRAMHQPSHVARARDANKHAKFLHASHHAANGLALVVSLQRLPHVLSHSPDVLHTQLRHVAKLLRRSELHLHAPSVHVARKHAARNHLSTEECLGDIRHAAVAQILQQAASLNAIREAHKHTLGTTRLDGCKAHGANARCRHQNARSLSLSHVAVNQAERLLSPGTSQAWL